MKFFEKKHKYKFRFSIVLPVKNENDYLIDFIKYYKYHGVDHFYFYDNDSQIPVKETLKDYLSICTITDFSGVGIQMQVYSHYLENYKKDSKWIAVVDIDEFIFPKKHNKIIDFLEENEKYDAIAINWLMFGDGNNLKKVDGPLIKNYLYSQVKQHPNFKTIYKTEAISKLHHPHFGKLKWFKKYVDAKRNKITNHQNLNFTQDIIQINHYFSRSEEEFLIKIQRQRADTGERYIDIPGNKDWIYDEHKRDNEVFNDEIWVKYKNIYD
jgi:hypothetical protein